MTFFSGFSLQGEKELFSQYIDESDFCVAGFSLGAIEAIQYALEHTRRIDKIQLFSPAFFVNKDKKYKRLQEIFYQKDAEAYTQEFLKNITFPSAIDMQKYYRYDSAENLHALLYYPWDKEILQSLQDRAIMIEVYLGERDKIINANAAREFFRAFATVTWIKNAGHILRGENG